MTRRFFLILASVLLAVCGATAQKLTPHKGDVPGAYNFWFYTPYPTLENEDEPKPLVVFLHGASLCGNNLDRVRRYGTIDAIEKGRKLDAYVIAPQNPGGAWKPEKIMKIIDWVGDNHNLDYDRVYVIGMSLGGYGTIDLVATYPDEIAAAMAFCGGGSVSDLSGLAEVPLWIVHGTADNAVSVSQSDKVVNAVKATGDASRLIYNRVPGMNHAQPARFLYMQESYDWLMSHSLQDEDRPVTQPFDFTGNVLHKAYQGLKRSNSAGTKKKSASKRRRSSRKRR